MPSAEAESILKTIIQLVTLKYPYPPPDHVRGKPPPPPQDPFALPLQAYVLLYAYVLLFVTRLPAKLRATGLLVACFFAPIEYLFYMATTEDPNTGAIEPNWDLLSGKGTPREGHTTVYQFAANVFLGGPLFYFYLEGFKRLSALPWVVVALLRALTVPLLIWTLEIVEGYILIFLYGYNPAWHYYGDDALFHGNVKLSYWKYWLPLGVVAEFWGWYLLAQLADAITPFIKTRKEQVEEKAKLLEKSKDD
ncbi:hypothetical protein HDU96_004394 [Phlyctochytrium bullatum]|nr:hypothetical protein HDU96_004394 [Phlyctochytrium bullatum]